MEDLMLYKEYLLERYENLRKRRVSVVDCKSDIDKRIARVHNGKIKLKMDRLKVCLDNLNYYMEVKC